LRFQKKILQTIINKNNMSNLRFPFSPIHPFIGVEPNLLLRMQTSYNMQIAKSDRKLGKRLTAIRKIASSVALCCLILLLTSCNDKDDDITPKADFTYSIEGLTVTFTNTSEDAKNYEWNFGDSNTSNEQSPVHSYTSNGEYTVSLKAINGSKNDSKSEKIKVIRPEPKADFKYTIDNLRVTFTNLSDDANSYEWNFGDGSNSIEKNPAHTYSDYGIYNVSLKAINGSESDTKNETITLIKPLIFIDGDFSDWDDVPATLLAVAELPDNAERISAKVFKACADANHIYVYIKCEYEQSSHVSIHFDTDNNAETGWISYNMWERCGANWMIEGTIYDRFGWFSVFYYNDEVEDKTDWNNWINTYAPSNIVSISQLVQYPEESGIIHFEMRISREMISTDLASEIGIGIFVTNDNWEHSGYLPQRNIGEPLDPQLKLKIN